MRCLEPKLSNEMYRNRLSANILQWNSSDCAVAKTQQCAQALQNVSGMHLGWSLSFEARHRLTMNDDVHCLMETLCRKMYNERNVLASASFEETRQTCKVLIRLFNDCVPGNSWRMVTTVESLATMPCPGAPVLSRTTNTIEQNEKHMGDIDTLSKIYCIMSLIWSTCCGSYARLAYGNTARGSSTLPLGSQILLICQRTAPASPPCCKHYGCMAENIT